MILSRSLCLRRTLAAAAFLLLLLGPGGAVAAGFSLDPAFPHERMRGPAAAEGAIIYSHGRSVDSEDSLTPTPPYMAALQRDGWDAYRFDRLRAVDTLPDSARHLVGIVHELRQKGYRRVVLTGQSFGAFLSLMAADASDEVHAVIATAPAAYGDFADYYGSWRENATQLYPLLQRVRNARVMLFYFHGDDFDPGGRGPRSETILSARNIDHLVVDQPPELTTHWAATTGLFVRRFAGCIRDFIEAKETDQVTCHSSWGDSPSQQIAFPAHFHSVAVTAAERRFAPFAGKWYGHYGNGREVMFGIERVSGDTVTAVYSVGPGVEPGEKAEWVRRTGHLRGNELVFDEKGLNVLRYQLRPDGRLQAWWISKNGQASMETTLRRTGEPDTPAPTIAAAGGH